LLEGRAEVR